MKNLIIILIGDGDSNSISSIKLSIKFKVKFTSLQRNGSEKKESRLPDLAER